MNHHIETKVVKFGMDSYRVVLDRTERRLTVICRRFMPSVQVAHLICRGQNWRNTDFKSGFISDDKTYISYRIEQI